MSPALVLLLGLHLGASLFSLGYWHADEHFQILEWMSYLEGHTPRAALAWEFSTHIRGWLAPDLLYSLTRPLRWVGIENPLALESALRMAAAAFALWVSWRLIKSFREELGEERTRMAGALLLGGAALPFLHARLSSEALSTAFFLWALSERRRPMAAGLLAGLAFGFRYQSALLLGAFLPVAWRERKPTRYLTLGIFGYAISLSFEALLDRVGYGIWSFPAWEYFRLNVVEGQAASFGTAPWWQYAALFAGALPPLGLALVVAFCVYVYRFWREPLAWALVPFVVAHSALAHKELRFLTPLLWTSPLWLAQVLPPWRSWAKPLLYGALGLNFLYFVVLSFQPARSEIGFYRWVWRTRPARLEILGQERGSDPFVHANLPLNFYRPPELESVRVDKASGGFIVTAEAPATTCQIAYDSTPPLLPASLLTRLKLRTIRVWKCPI